MGIKTRLLPSLKRGLKTILSSWKFILKGILLVGFIFGIWYAISFAINYFGWDQTLQDPLFIVVFSPWIFFWAAIHYRKLPYPYRFILLLIILTTVVVVFAQIYHKTGIVDNSGHIVKDLPNCVYFSIVTFTTLGSGDFRPLPDSRLFVAIEVCMGYLYFGVLVGVLAAYVIHRVKQEEAKPYIPMI